MLYKSLISMYGSSLAGTASPKEDVVGRLVTSENLMQFRLYALNALQQAKVYLLDHLAAAYADTLHETITENAGDKSLSALVILGEVQLPYPVVWVEFDNRALAVARFERASTITRFDDKPLGNGLRGYLIDGRNDGLLLVTLFHKPSEKGIIDPLCSLRVKRSASGALDHENIEGELHQFMVEFYTRVGENRDRLEKRFYFERVEAGYDLFIPYALLAMLESPDLGGIIPTETEIFSPKEVKTARKFGKPWVLGAQKSHLTIRIGPQAAAHMAEKTARLEFERQAMEARNGPVRHWVSEHERHYRSGKVVLVKGHHRGNEPARNLPTRVMGPQPEAVRFTFPPK